MWRRRMAAVQRWSVVLTLLLITAVGCGGPTEDPILILSATESLEAGKALLAKEKYADARKYFNHAFEVEPNSAAGREGLLLAADTLYLQGATTHLIQAEAKYRDFLNRFPTSDRAAYVQFQVGNCLFEQIEKPDRDQSATHKALDAYTELVRLYPSSEYAAKAEEKTAELRSHLAEHEFLVARFYLRYGLPAATVSRLEYLLDHYPEYQERDQVYYLMGLAHHHIGEAEEADKWFKKLREEYPGSKLIADIPKQIEAQG